MILAKALLPLSAVRRRFIDDRRGAVLVELAIALPIVVGLIINGFDVGRYVLLHQKMDRAASTVADLVSRPASISQDDINITFSAASELMQPFDLGNEGVVIVSSISKAAGDSAEIDWQYDGGGSLSATSQIGTVGGTPTLPPGFDLRDDENLIVAEVFFDFDPVFLGFLLKPGVKSRYAIRRPRRGDLSELN